MERLMEELRARIVAPQRSFEVRVQDELKYGDINNHDLIRTAARLAGIFGSVKPQPLQKGLVIFAAAHAVNGAENKMKGADSHTEAERIATGKDELNKAAHKAGVGVLLLDMGLQKPLTESPGVQSLRVAAGSRYFAQGTAMTRQATEDAFMIGVDIAQRLADEGYTALGMGNVGERWPLTALAVTAVFFRNRLVTEPESTKQREAAERFLSLIDETGVVADRPIQLLERIGSPDLAAMTGFILSAAERKIPVVLDNALTVAAFLIGEAICEGVRDYVFTSVAYDEPVQVMQFKGAGLQAPLAGKGLCDRGMGSVAGLSYLESAVTILHEQGCKQ